jgi:hypothetical protein
MPVSADAVPAFVGCGAARLQCLKGLWLLRGGCVLDEHAAEGVVFAGLLGVHDAAVGWVMHCQHVHVHASARPTPDIAALLKVTSSVRHCLSSTHRIYCGICCAFSTTPQIASLVMMMFMLFGGFLLNKERVPPYCRWTSVLSFFNYAYEVSRHRQKGEWAVWRASEMLPPLLQHVWNAQHNLVWHAADCDTFVACIYLDG